MKGQASKGGTPATAAGALGAPILLVIAVRGIVGGASDAPAAPWTNEPPPTATVPAMVPITEGERAAGEWSRNHRVLEKGVSPMRPPEVRPLAAKPAPKAAEVEAAPEASPFEGFKLSSIMGHDRGGVVAAQGRVFRFGDEIVPGWRISSIDARGRSVSVRGP